MSKQLVIVESPAKGRTIERYLGTEFMVRASYGHVRDLPEKSLGVKVDDHFEPEYQIIPKARRTIAMLRQAVAQSDDVYLATDYDREGEAIAWHVVEALGLNKSQISNLKSQNFKRITFHEITKPAIEEAIKHPRAIDMNLVDAQQGRRVLDRLVGYKLSPFLWQKVLKGLSAGRVQSVAVRLIVDREREIEQFDPQEYWTIVGHFKTLKEEEFEAQLVEYQGKKLGQFDIQTKTQAERIVNYLLNSNLEFRVSKFETAEQFRWPFPPFTTSTLQQEANRRLGFSAKKTMKLAQDLYEAGQITYMRTDSTNLSWLAVNTTRAYIKESIGEQYLSEKPHVYKTKTLAAQEAHEAIRPTYIQNRQPKPRGRYQLSTEHNKLYDLIWRRLVACQMHEAVLATTTILVEGTGEKPATFQATGATLKFDGFLKIYPIEVRELKLPSLASNAVVELIKVGSNEHFTKPPDRYTEATLVKALEQHGIGRPSTYAPIISTIQERSYVRLQRRHFYPELVGRVVTKLLVEHFPQIVDIGFTAQMEKELDEIAEGKKVWQAVVQDFYQPFAKVLKQKELEVGRYEFSEIDQASCPKCGQSMVVRTGRFGLFLACNGYPNCKTTQPINQMLDIACPDCQQGKIVERRSRKGAVFYGCSRYPQCKYVSWEKPKKNLKA